MVTEIKYCNKMVHSDDDNYAYDNDDSNNNDNELIRMMIKRRLLSKLWFVHLEQS